MGSAARLCALLIIDTVSDFGVGMVRTWPCMP